VNAWESYNHEAQSQKLASLAATSAVSSVTEPSSEYNGTSAHINWT